MGFIRRSSTSADITEKMKYDFDQCRKNIAKSYFFTIFYFNCILGEICTTTLVCQLVL